MLMTDVVFIEYVVDAGFSRGYAQKSYFFIQGNFIFLERDVYG